MSVARPISSDESVTYLKVGGSIEIIKGVVRRSVENPQDPQTWQGVIAVRDLLATKGLETSTGIVTAQYLRQQFGMYKQTSGEPYLHVLTGTEKVLRQIIEDYDQVETALETAAQTLIPAFKDEMLSSIDKGYKDSRNYNNRLFGELQKKGIAAAADLFLELLPQFQIILAAHPQTEETADQNANIPPEAVGE